VQQMRRTMSLIRLQLLLAVAWMLISSQTILAINSYPEPISISQPDGMHRQHFERRQT
jgi:hypothetical protein